MSTGAFGTGPSVGLAVAPEKDEALSTWGHGSVVEQACGVHKALTPARKI